MKLAHHEFHQLPQILQDLIIRVIRGQKICNTKMEIKMGKCPDCGNSVGPISIISSWDNWGKFICPGCGSKIQFKGWLLVVAILTGLFVGAERILHWMLLSQLPLWLSFAISSVLAMLILFFVPKVWTFRNAAGK
jgi:DNA-directed RNA polymerase subunit RPC12/RpoP